MKYIKYVAEIEDAMGNTGTIPDPDKTKRKEYDAQVKAIREEAVGEAKRLGIKIQDVPVIMPEFPMIEADFAQAMCYFANNIPWERDEKNQAVNPAKPEEIDHAMLVVRGFRNPQKGLVAIPDSSLKWVVEELEAHGGRAFPGTFSGELRRRLKVENVLDGLPPELEDSEDSEDSGESIAKNKITDIDAKRKGK